MQELRVEEQHAQHAVHAVHAQGEGSPRARLLGRFKGLLVLGVAVSLVFVLLVRVLIATNSSAAPKASLGSPAANFTITTWNAGQQPLSLASFAGHPVVVNFWQASSISCRDEAQMLQQEYVKYAPYHVQFIGVALGTTQSEGMSYLKRFGITYPNGPDPSGSIAGAYGLAGTPETMFINSQGKVAREIVGEAQANLVEYYIAHDLLR